MCVVSCHRCRYPNLKTTRDLVYKRGYGKINKSRIPLSENATIEAELGSLGVICIEDMIHEIVTAGPNFKQVNRTIPPLLLGALLCVLCRQEKVGGRLERGDRTFEVLLV